MDIFMLNLIKLFNLKKSKKKIIEWLKRYLPAELTAIAGALAGALIIYIFTKNYALISIGGTIGETAGYSAMMFFTELTIHKKKDKKLTGLGFIKTFRNLFIEFGGA